ncbi:MAG: cytochrome b5 domain-containing protein [bacterium]
MRVQSREEISHAVKLFDFVNGRGGRVVLKAIVRKSRPGISLGLASKFSHAFAVFPIWMGRMFAEMKTYTLEELSKYNGRDGSPAYVAYKGKVYDVTKSFLWMGGSHQGIHRAGADLTEDMERAPHGEELLTERFPVVGVLLFGRSETC